MSLPIAKLPESERPRERLLRLGAVALSDAELVAIQLGSGRRGESALELATALLVEWGGLAGLATAGIDELARRPGVGEAKAARLVAAFALADRTNGPPDGAILSTSADIAAVAAPLIGRARTEQVLLIVADHKQRVRRVLPVAAGRVAGAAVPVREVLVLALRHDAVAVALAHNHPSGDPTPSPEDEAVTDRIRSAVEDVGLRFLDHVVVGGGTWRSGSAPTAGRLPAV
jgi:DNA repair protein RadC